MKGPISWLEMPYVGCSQMMNRVAAEEGAEESDDQRLGQQFKNVELKISAISSALEGGKNGLMDQSCINDIEGEIHSISSEIMLQEQHAPALRALCSQLERLRDLLHEEKDSIDAKINSLHKARKASLLYSKHQRD